MEGECPGTRQGGRDSCLQGPGAPEWRGGLDKGQVWGWLGMVAPTEVSVLCMRNPTGKPLALGLPA